MDIVKYLAGPVSFFIAKSGKTTFTVGCVTVGCVLQRSKHRSLSAAEKSLHKFVNEWNNFNFGVI
jgi:hypothetical protein